MIDVDFGVPEDVAQRLMNESEFEAMSGDTGMEPFAQDVLGLYIRKVKAYLSSIEPTVH